MVLSTGGVVLAVAVLVLLALHTAVAAVALRFFRLRLATRWGAVLYTLVAAPLVYLITTLVVFGVLGVGDASLTLDRGTLLTFLWALPLSVGISIELFWMPPPGTTDASRRTA